ncbi:hypothetical protein J1614_006068 [Plenodomus biglobosus]|nr:hypothetical protein J1614_006068 [Plenodomus biglobosus]
MGRFGVRGGDGGAYAAGAKCAVARQTANSSAGLSEVGELLPSRALDTALANGDGLPLLLGVPAGESVAQGARRRVFLLSVRLGCLSCPSRSFNGKPEQRVASPGTTATNQHNTPSSIHT